MTKEQKRLYLYLNNRQVLIYEEQKRLQELPGQEEAIAELERQHNNLHRQKMKLNQQIETMSIFDDRNVDNDNT